MLGHTAFLFVVLASPVIAQSSPTAAPSCTVPRLPPSSLTYGPGGTVDAIEGIVISHRTLEAIKGALVEIRSQRVRVTTDSLGRFRIAGIPHGDYELSALAFALGLGPARATVTFEGPTHVVAVLASAAIADFECIRPAPPKRPPSEEL